jgi:Sec-independent protein translocase protein TatA
MENQQRQTTAGVTDGGAINNVKSEAAGVAQEVKRHGEEQFEARKQTAADQTEKLAGVVDRVSEDLKDQNQESLADYAGQLAGSMKNFAESLRQRNLDDLVNDTQQLARNNPTLFLMGSVAVGIALSRFLKASADRSGSNRRDDSGFYDSSRSDSSQSIVQPITFESAESATTTPPAKPDSPSFADDLEKGV